MPLFEDLFYPDNKSRAMRASELVYDCNSAISIAASEKTEIDALLKKANEAIAKAFEKFSFTIPVTQNVPITDGIGLEMADILLQILNPPAVSDAFNYAVKCYLESEGRIGEAAFIDIIGLPSWFKIGKYGSMAAAAVVIEAIVSAVDGAANRSTLQDAIKKLITPRYQARRAFLVNEQLKITLSAVIDSYETLTSVLKEATQEQLKDIADTLIKKHSNEVAKVSDPEYIKSDLNAFDKNRKSWTSEDSSPDISEVTVALTFAFRDGVEERRCDIKEPSCYDSIRTISEDINDKDDGEEDLVPLKRFKPSL